MSLVRWTALEAWAFQKFPGRETSLPRWRQRLQQATDSGKKNCCLLTWDRGQGSWTLPWALTTEQGSRA